MRWARSSGTMLMDDVLMQPKCYFYWTRENYKLCFIATDDSMHKTGGVHCPWIITSAWQMLLCGESNSYAERIVERLIVYSCFMAHSNLDTFMISLRAHERQLLFPIVKREGGGEKKRGFILTPGFIECVISITAPARQLLLAAERQLWDSGIIGGLAKEREGWEELFKFVQMDGIHFFFPLASAKWKLSMTYADLSLLSVGNCSKCTLLSALMRQSFPPQCLINKGSLTFLPVIPSFDIEKK